MNLATGFRPDQHLGQARRPLVRNGPECPGHTCGDKEIRNSPEKGPCRAVPRLGLSSARATPTARFSSRPTCQAKLPKSFAAGENVKVAGGELVPAEAGKPARSRALQSPYIITQAYRPPKAWTRSKSASTAARSGRPTGLEDFSEAVGGKYARLGAVDRQGRLSRTCDSGDGAVQPLRPALPVAGQEHVTVSVADPKALGDNRLVVTYAYRPGCEARATRNCAEEDKEIARASLRQVGSRRRPWCKRCSRPRDLPATFEIDVPTPKDKYPVYPRMLFVRREVLGRIRSRCLCPKGPGGRGWGRTTS